jgi:Resolvase, N terminal domain
VKFQEQSQSPAKSQLGGIGKQMAKDSKSARHATALHKQAVIYARVSSKEQEKEGFSIPAQLKLLKDYAARQGFTVAKEYVDVETAKKIGRTAFGEMIAHLKAQPSVRILLVEKTDRLYRNLKDWVTVDELRAYSRGEAPDYAHNSQKHESEAALRDMPWQFRPYPLPI